MIPGENEIPSSIPRGIKQPIYPGGHNEYWVVDAEPSDIMPPPGRGNGSDPELLDSPIGLFHYPSPGALLRLPGSFLF